MQAANPNSTQFGPSSIFSLVLRVIGALLGLWIVATVIVLTIAFFLQFFAANMSTDFATWIMSHSQGVMKPFNGIFPSISLVGNSVLNTSMLFAILVYALIGGAIAALIAWLSGLFQG